VTELLRVYFLRRDDQTVGIRHKSTKLGPGVRGTKCAHWGTRGLTTNTSYCLDRVEEWISGKGASVSKKRRGEIFFEDNKSKTWGGKLEKPVLKIRKATERLNRSGWDLFRATKSQSHSGKRGQFFRRSRGVWDHGIRQGGDADSPFLGTTLENTFSNYTRKPDLMGSSGRFLVCFRKWCVVRDTGR